MQAAKVIFLKSYEKLNSIMKRRKILFVVTEDWYFCSHRLPLAVAAKKASYDVIVATRITNHQENIERNGIRTINLRYMKRSSLNILRELTAFFELLLLFRKEKPDLVHMVALKPVIYGSLAAQLLGVSCKVNALGGLGFIFSSKWALARFLRPIILTVFRFIFNDHRSRLILQNENDWSLVTNKAGVDRKNVRLIRSAGVNLDDYVQTELPDGTPIVILASRMLWDKGIDEFATAANLLREQGISARFVLVGEPDIENPSSVPREQLHKWNDAGVIEWWAYRENMPEVFSQASIVCLPSYYGEGVPKVLIEAMACARPIVTTDMPGCRDVIREEKNGILIKPKNAADLAGALELLLNNPSLCQKMGREGRLIAEKDYSLTKVIKETLNVYQELLSQ